MNAIEELKRTEDQYRVIGVSTCHILAEDAQRFSMIGSDETNMIMSRETGAFVKLYPDLDREPRNLEEDYPGFSDAFYNVLKLAKEAGYSMVEFDSAATEYESLSSFDW